MNIFAINDYKQILKAAFDEHENIRGYKAQMADAANCQRSYLSQVLNSHVHLTLEHAHGIGVFLKFNPDEQDYFLTLVEFERSGDQSYRHYLKQKLVAQRVAQKDLMVRYKKQDSFESDGAATYYSYWFYSAIHILLTIPQFQTPTSIAKRLDISEQIVLMVLKELQKLGLAKNVEGKWLPTKKNIHLAKHSPWISRHHSNWRDRAVKDSFDKNSQSIHYTSLYSLSRGDLELLLQMSLDFIDKSRQVVEPSKEEELVAFNLDIFAVK